MSQEVILNDPSIESIQLAPAVRVKRGRGRPQLTDEQRIERDKKRSQLQHEYYVQNKEKISIQQKEVKGEKYKNNPEFRQKAIDYIKQYNKRRTAIVQFVTEYKDEVFQKALGKYLVENL